MTQFTTHEQKASYGIGRQIGDQLSQQSFDGLDLAAVKQGIEDAVLGKAFAVDQQEIGEAFEVITERLEAAERELAVTAQAQGEAFLSANAARDEVTVTDSGLQYEVLVEGKGSMPAKGDKVRVHYHGTFPDGRVFDSSVRRGQPAEFPVTGVIAGWVEALQLMPVGSKWKLTIPHHLAYGERGAGSIPPFSTLVFEVELLDIV
ncbi:FKBP-type peptidyl-prolyl cis-trans isomerase [Pseudaeromonas sharmana]|uniref:Peptidyl-prolyl cis-trans isomerase n=1 Tax=Pseudaeromonas sharmana TaxID=328412 RepID=A0ABV8CKB6_9GAMM